MVKEVIIYTDGACKGNPGPGGWGVVLIYGDVIKELQGSEKNTTNNRMEMTAAIEGLSALKEPCRVKLYSDSAYLINAFQKNWLKKWQMNGWITSGKTPVENQDLWMRLLELTRKHRVEWIKVAGHRDDEYNNRCDYLASNACKSEEMRGTS